MATMSQEEKRMLEERRKEEEDRVRAEEEFLRKHREEKRLGKDVGELSGPSRTTSVSSLAESDGEEQRKRRREKDGSPDKNKKKKNEDEDDEDEEVFGDDPIRNMDLGLSQLTAWLRQANVQRLVTRPQQKKFEKIVRSIREEVTRCREEMARMETRVEERKTLVDVVKKTVREELERKKEESAPVVANYASALGRKEGPKVPKVTGLKGPVLPAPKLVIVKHETKDCEEVKATLKRLVKPSEIGLKVKRLINIRNGVIVEAESEIGAENLRKHTALKEAGLKVDKPMKKRPVIMIYDVTADLKDDEIKEEVYTRNVQGIDISAEEFKNEFEVRHKYKDVKSRGKRCHIVVECSVRVRNVLRAKEKIFIEWQSCRVKDYVDVARCYKCQRFGHIAKHCSSEKPACSYCAGEHDYKDCPDKQKRDKVCCINCKREKRVDVKHDAGWRRCPGYEKAVKRENEKIDYGL